MFLQNPVKENVQTILGAGICNSLKINKNTSKLNNYLLTFAFIGVRGGGAGGAAAPQALENLGKFGQGLGVFRANLGKV